MATLHRHWTFHEGSGTSTTCVVSADVATFVNTVNWSTDVPSGRSGYSLGFGGTSYARATKGDSNVCTIAFWVKRTAEAAVNDGLFQVQFGGTTPSTGSGDKLIGGWVQSSDDRAWGRLRDTAGNKSLPTTDGNTALALNAWYHVAYRADGAAYQFFKDGVQYTGVAYNGDIAAQDVLFMAIQGDEGLMGLLHDFRVYNEALTDAEIMDLYTGGGPTRRPRRRAMDGGYKSTMLGGVRG